jgi:hypothetical protein
MKNLKRFKKNYERHLKGRKIPLRFRLMNAGMWAASAFTMADYIVEYPGGSATLKLNNAIQFAACAFVFAFALSFFREAKAFVRAVISTAMQTVSDIRSRPEEEKA